MQDNQLSRYGAIAKAVPLVTGKVFFVIGATEPMLGDFMSQFPSDNDGVARVYTTFTPAIAACTAGNGDVIMVSPGYTTALTAAELLSATTKGVGISQAAGVGLDGVYTVSRATAALPASTAAALFTITGRVELISIVGEVTTVIQTQADNTKLISNPTVGADVDICAVKDITAAAVGTQFSITGTLATAMVQTASAAFVKQAAPVVLTAGTLDLSCAATNTGSVKWTLQYKPIDAGARVFAA